jgi:cobalt-zinc-cadmium efflux system protein
VWVDQLVSVVIGIFILWTSWSVIRESVDVLLESAPAHLDMKLVEDTVKGVAGVITIHDLHVWTISSNMLACSCHVVVSKHTVEEGQQVIKNIVKELETRFHIGHTTIQIEIEGCDPNDMYCSIGRGGH